MSADIPQNDRVFLHPQAICESGAVGPRTRVWAFAHVLPGATIGADCNICDHVFIENDVRIGDRVTIKSGVQLWDGLRLGDDVFVGPNATFSNDKFPRSKQYQATVDETFVARGASIGAGAVVLPGIRIGQDAMVGAGAVVTHDVPARAIVSGNPARIVGYVNAPPRHAEVANPITRTVQERVHASTVRGVTVHQLTRAQDLRGTLTAGEFGETIPFTPKRYFVIFDVPTKEIRGEHAHRSCHQFLVCLRGSVTVVVDDGTSAEQIELREPDMGLYVPPMVWAVQFRYAPDALLAVFASDHYDAADYIRDYDEFLSLVRR
jgi:acetyltransferase-like isoleucine patch superfamily enzyme/dTDP-4-dehydrorhamnose 3,5-epimerase-like enzyme